MAVQDDVNNIKKKINSIYEKRRAQIIGICLYYTQLSIQYFWSVQPPIPNTQGAFWHNWTGQAAARMFTGTIEEGEILGWYMAHGVDYGVYLELANDRRFESIRPIIQRYAGRFFADCRKLYEGGE
jgi:hypothetical protein